MKNYFLSNFDEIMRYTRNMLLVVLFALIVSIVIGFLFFYSNRVDGAILMYEQELNREIIETMPERVR